MVRGGAQTGPGGRRGQADVQVLWLLPQDKVEVVLGVDGVVNVGSGWN